MEYIALVVGTLFLAAASWHDLRTREVPDLLSYGLLLFGIAYPTIAAIVQWDWLPLAQMGIGLGVMLALGLLLFYTGQWGGADSKLLFGLGALLGLGFGNWDAILFLIFMLFAGAAYGLLYTLVLVIKHRKAFKQRFVALIREPRVKRLRIIVLASCFLLLVLILLAPMAEKALLILLVIAIYGLFYAWIFVKAVEQGILIKSYPVSKLTEGDWINEEVKVRGKHICGPKDLGITKAQIAQLKKLKVKKVMVKEGIPFVPSFLIGYLLLWFVGPYVYALL